MATPIPFKVLIPTKKKDVEKLMCGNENLINCYVQSVDYMNHNVETWGEDMDDQGEDYRTEKWQMEFVLDKIETMLEENYQMDKDALKDASKGILAKYAGKLSSAGKKRSK